MSSTQATTRDSAPALSSRTSWALAAILGFCLVMIGTTGYVKYQLDRSEVTLSAPDSAFTPDQEIYEKTVVALGYSGFLGSAQTYMNLRDRATLGDLRMNYKTAQETISRLGDKAPAAVRRDLKGIMDTFASILAKAEEGGDAMSAGITNADILAASSALNMLDSRLQSAMSANRMKAQESFKAWSLGLMLIAWCGLILSAGLGAGLYLSLRGDRKSEALQNLAQSVKNLSLGDTENPIWGLERSDIVGDVARALDAARLYFTRLPDLTLSSDEGPVRLKFEGEARSMFQSMMRNITDNFERAQQSTLGFTGMMNAQQDMLSSLATRMNAILAQIQQHDSSNEESIKSLTSALSDAIKTVTETQEASATQVGRLVPYMQERVQNMAEVTHLAGSQVAQSLQSLLKSEQTLRGSATQSETVVKQLASATNQMGERMFAALNLMQASSKMLNETTDNVRSRFNEAVDTLGRGETHLTQIITRAESRLASTVNAEENMASLAARTESSAQKMEKAVNAIYDRHESLNEQVVTAAHRMDSIVASFDAAQRSMTDAANQIRRDGSLIANLLQELRANNDQLLSSVSQNSQTSFTAVQSLAEKSHALMQRLEVQIQQQAAAAESRIDELAVHSQSMANQASTTNSTLAQTVAALRTEQEKLATTRNRFSETVADIGSRFEQQATATFGKTEQWAAQSFTKLTTIAEQMESVMSRLNMLGQLTGTLGTVAGQLGQLVPTLTQYGSSLPVAAVSGEAPVVQIDLESTKALIVEQTEQVLKELQQQWHGAVVQIEAMHDQLAQIVVAQKDQLETRLVVMDKKIREASEAILESSAADDKDGETVDERQTEIMNEIVSAISRINEHVLELDGVIEDAGLKKEA